MKTLRQSAPKISWESALERFISPWRERKYVLGALVTGSRAFGIADKRSDIDVLIVMGDKVKWRERGNRCIGGFLVEYLANPIQMYSRYHSNDLKNGSRITVRMLAHGSILFDKDGSIGRLQAWARKMMNKTLPGSGFSEPAKYHMWDFEDGLLALKERHSPGFWYLYYLGLDRVIEAYRRYLGQEIPAQSKMWDFFSSEKFRHAHRMKPFPDRRFMAIVKRCMKIGTVTGASREFSQLVAHVQKRMGGFQIDGWRFRSKAE